MKEQDKKVEDYMLKHGDDLEKIIENFPNIDRKKLYDKWKNIKTRLRGGSKKSLIILPKLKWNEQEVE